MRFSDFVEINPAVKLRKGLTYPFIAMEDVAPGRRYVSPQIERVYRGGGAKFLSGDTLFARITPCLENGKIAQFLASDSELGFGSTEFFVFRHREGISDPGYVFYLAYTNIVRKPAEKSMVGASGRQRADLASIRYLDVPAPPLATQRKIAAILSAYDDLIENNLRRIKILEEMARLIYREWFVNFRFPGHENVKMIDSPLGRIPEGWEIKKTKEVVKRLKAGNTYTMNDVEEIGEVIVVDQSRNEYLGFHSNEADHKASPDKPIIIFGDHTCKMQLMVEPFSVGPNVVPFVAVNNLSIYYVFFLVKDLVSTQEYKRHWTELSNKQVAVSLTGITKQFANLVIPMFEDIETLRRKNINLSCTRDLLLPKLISRELDVSELDIDIGEEPA